MLGYRTVDLYDDNNWALSVLVTVLGRGMSSRLFKRMRDELGICYYVGARQSAFTTHGQLVIRAGVANDRAEEAVKVILEEVAKLVSEDVPADELAKAKALKTGSMAMNLESSDSFADFFGFQELHHEKIMPLDAQIKKINAVTAKDVRATAKRFLKGATLNLAMVGPHQDEEKFLKLLKDGSKR
jgi:predicted Zn-dependent peptidase